MNMIPLESYPYWYNSCHEHYSAWWPCNLRRMEQQ